MRKLLFFYLLSIQFSVFSQENCNAFLKASFSEGSLPSSFDVLVKGNVDYLISNASSLGISVNYYAGDVASVRTSVNSLAILLASKYVSFVEYNYTKTETFSDTMLVKNRIKDVKTGASPLAQAYNGTGVVVGIMDSGIDFNHPDFKLSNGDTRIQFIWDQNQTSGSTVPAPYNYGIEWTAAQINASLCTHSDMASYGHGTHVSGIAAGNGLATGTHEGIASQADLVVVSMKFNSINNIYSDAVNYIFSKATALGKPCVINASVGNYYGSHDGTDLQTQLINNMLNANSGRVLVAAAGNAGNLKMHTKTTINTTDTTFTWLRKNGSPIYHFVYADTAQFKNIKMSIAANRPNFEDLGRIPLQTYTYGISGIKTDTLKNNGNRIGIIKTTSSINSFGVYERFFQIIPDSNNYYWRVEATGNGLYDSWNFDFVSTNLPSVSQYSNIVNYIMPDTISTIVSGFQCSDEVITVGNYINKNTWYDVNNTLQNSGEVQGKIKETSSGGPTRDNRVKPEVVATGANVFAAMALGMQANLVANAPSAVAPGSMHVQGGGTSASSPVVAGLAALYLEAYPNATNQQVRDAIKNCTYSDGFTGSLPNNVYGYGKLDGKAAMLCAIFTGINTVKIENGIKAYPNPFQDKIQFTLPDNFKGTVNVYDVSGKQILTEQVNNETYTLNKSQLTNYSGLLMIHFIDETSVYSVKVIAQ